MADVQAKCNFSFVYKKKSADSWNSFFNRENKGKETNMTDGTVGYTT